MENKGKSAVHYLTALLHYHERMMLGTVAEEQNGTLNELPYSWAFDGYKDALEEAIRCVKEVNEGGLKQQREKDVFHKERKRRANKDLDNLKGEITLLAFGEIVLLCFHIAEMLLS